jgi:hypothetical protein
MLLFWSLFCLVSVVLSAASLCLGYLIEYFLPSIVSWCLFLIQFQCLLKNVRVCVYIYIHICLVTNWLKVGHFCFSLCLS